MKTYIQVFESLKISSSLAFSRPNEDYVTIYSVCLVQLRTTFQWVSCNEQILGELAKAIINCWRPTRYVRWQNISTHTIDYVILNPILNSILFAYPMALVISCYIYMYIWITLFLNMTLDELLTYILVYVIMIWTYQLTILMLCMTDDYTLSHARF